MVLARARRIAKRRRSEKACLPCKSKKAKCSDYRPCMRCKESNGQDACTDGLQSREIQTGEGSDLANSGHNVPAAFTNSNNKQNIGIGSFLIFQVQTWSLCNSSSLHVRIAHAQLSKKSYIDSICSQDAMLLQEFDCPQEDKSLMQCSQPEQAPVVRSSIIGPEKCSDLEWAWEAGGEGFESFEDPFLKEW
jgi:hypothetical protein